MRSAVLEWLAARQMRIVGTGGRRIRLLGRRDDPLIGELAALPQVRTIDEYREPTLSNDYRLAFGIDGADGTPAVPWTGRDQVVGIADSGVDRLHPALAGRITRVVNCQIVWARTIERGRRHRTGPTFIVGLMDRNDQSARARPQRRGVVGVHGRRAARHRRVGHPALPR